MTRNLRLRLLLILLGGVYGAITTQIGHQLGYADGRAEIEPAVRRARTEERTEARRQLQLERAECNGHIQQTRADADDVCDREREIWGSNIEAMRADLVHEEEDLERCYHMRRTR